MTFYVRAAAAPESLGALLPQHMRRAACHALLLACLWAPPLLSSAGTPPPLMLAEVYRQGVPLADYWVSEKLDGIRGYWDGRQLLTRGGERVNAPAWFTAGWPAQPMDGELWAGRGQFSKSVSTARQQTPDDEAWRSMRFMVFDLPQAGGTFNERLVQLNALLAVGKPEWLQTVVQRKVTDHAALKALLDRTIKLGGEGLMLHRGGSLYRAERNGDLLKFKKHDDAEARVVGHLPGKGKHGGRLGSLLVEIPARDGRPALRFKLGTGLSDAERETPPAIGTLVTFRYRGFNDSGIPRFASYLRVREDGVGQR
jgi:DNA ligase 1